MCVCAFATGGHRVDDGVVTFTGTLVPDVAMADVGGIGTDACVRV